MDRIPDFKHGHHKAGICKIPISFQPIHFHVFTGSGNGMESVGYYVLLIMAALQTVPSNIYEAAELDSTPKWRVFFKITLPMISPTILFTSVVASIASFKIFDSVNVMTQGGPVDSTNTLVYYIYSFAFRYGNRVWPVRQV